MSDGLKIELSAMPNGLTVTPDGRKLLSTPFVFQCSPLEEFRISHTFNFGTYDTITKGQRSRWGSRQLDVWQFDTLALYLDPWQGKVFPEWVPYPNAILTAHIGTPMWYRLQLWDLLNAGCPMRFRAWMPGDEGAVRLAYATLTAFTESYKAGRDRRDLLHGRVVPGVAGPHRQPDRSEVEHGSQAEERQQRHATHVAQGRQGRDGHHGDRQDDLRADPNQERRGASHRHTTHALGHRQGHLRRPVSMA